MDWVTFVSVPGFSQVPVVGALNRRKPWRWPLVWWRMHRPWTKRRPWAVMVTDHAVDVGILSIQMSSSVPKVPLTCLVLGLHKLHLVVRLSLGFVSSAKAHVGP